MNKKRLVIVVGILLVIIAATIAVIVVIQNSNKEEIKENNKTDYSIKVTGKLEQYIANLTDNYYIKYSGKFKNNSGELTQAIVEYTKVGDNFGVRSSELEMHLICEGEKIYTISNKYKMIIELPKTNIDVKEYNLAADIGQVFVKSYREKIDNTEYDVEEYLFNGKTLKYYFKEKDIKLIRHNGVDIKIIRLELKTNTEILTKPEGYARAIV